MTEPTVDADAFNEFEAAGWQRQAAGYDDFFGRITGRLVEPLLDAANVGRNTRVLDVASGPGYVAVKAAERGASVVGVDIADAMLSLARQLHPQLEFRSGNAEALPFPDGSFDAVVGNFVLLHLGRPEQAAAEFARVLGADGRLALTVWDVPEKARFLGVMLDAVAAAGASPPADIPVGPPFFRFSDDEEFARLLRDQGFEHTEVRTISFTLDEPSSEGLWRGLLGGTVRTSALILRQASETQREIRAAFDEIVEQYEVGGQLELPVSVKLASARAPSAQTAGGAPSGGAGAGGGVSD
jgi:ubiquinone/menaquinone biosynthesis C-methylase UbiE